MYGRNHASMAQPHVAYCVLLQELVITQSRDATGVRVPMRASIAGHVARMGTPVHIDDAYTDPRFDRSVDEATGFRTRNMLCYPIKANDRVVAVIQAVNKKGTASAEFTANDLTILECMSGQAAHLLVKAQYMEQMVRWCRMATVTGRKHSCGGGMCDYSKTMRVPRRPCWR